MNSVNHIGVIMDGNRRWAKDRGLPTIEGHRAGVKALEQIVAEVRRRDVRVLTVYAFSAENWGRTPKEILDLQTVFSEGILGYTDNLVKQAVHMRFIGDQKRFPAHLRRSMRDAEAQTLPDHKMVFNVALGYGGRQEIVAAVRSLAADNRDLSRITEEEVSGRLFTTGQPDPDLVIRTGGVVRLSNFLPWQCVYSELFFTPTLWPEFLPEELSAILDEYAERQRRFGR